MIVLKHLAREFGLNPPMMRRVLREKFGYHKRWQWKPDDPELQAVRTFLSSLRSKKEIASRMSSVETEKSPTTTSRTSMPGRTLH